MALYMGLMSSCYQTNSVEALKDTQRSYPKQWPGHVLSFFSHHCNSEWRAFCSLSSGSHMPVSINQSKFIFQVITENYNVINAVALW